MRRRSEPVAFRLILDPPRPPAENMAIDHWLTHQLDQGHSPPVLRLYRWDRPTVSLGRSQTPGTTLLFTGLREHDFAWVRRPSGGKSVVHGEDLTYALVMPRTDLRSHARMFRLIHEAWAAAFERLGIGVDLARETKDLAGTPDCFSTQVPGEVLYHGSKVLGSAQYMTRGAVLQHGSLLMERDTRLLPQVLQLEGMPAPEVSRWQGTWATSVEESLIALFLEEFRRIFRATLQERPLSIEEVAQALQSLSAPT